MSLFKSALRTGVPGVVSLGLAGGLVALAPPSAAGGASLAKTVLSPVSAAARPNADVTGKPARYEPTRLKVRPAHGPCVSRNYSFSVTNRTSHTQKVMEYGAVAAEVRPGRKWLFCSSGPDGATIVFGLQHSGAKLSVVLK